MVKKIKSIIWRLFGWDENFPQILVDAIIKAEQELEAKEYAKRNNQPDISIHIMD